MTERLYRSQILLKPDQYARLAEIARQKGESVSHLVREIVGEYLTGQAEEMKEEAFERLLHNRQAMLARRGGKPIDIDITRLLDQTREERDDELSGELPDHRD
jgi:predicted DNA-binding protein